MASLTPLQRDSLVIAAFIFATIFAALLALNGGQFGYTIDDTYIHLGLAENLPWHYGVNAGEVSAPSSSPVFAWLLLLFKPFGLLDYAPLIINLIAAFGCIALGAKLAEEVALTPRNWSIPAQALALNLLFTTLNLYTLVFMGMEHVPHILCVLAIVAGLVGLEAGRRPSWWFYAAILAAPLMRYEGLALSGLCLLYLMWRGDWRRALAIGFAIVALLAAFSAYLVSLGLPPLPSSVLTKSGAVANAVAGSALWQGFQQSMEHAWHSSAALAIVALVPALVLRILIKSPNSNGQRRLAFLILLAVVAQLPFCRAGWAERLGTYAVILALLGVLYGYREVVWSWFARARLFYTLLLVWLVALLPVAAGSTLAIPIAVANIHEQQYQMYRFVTDYYKGPVGVNDLGRVSYQNPYPVLDMWGLASEKARAMKQSGWTTEELRQLVNEAGVGLLIIYPRVFHTEFPAEWVEVAEMKIATPTIHIPGSFVSFFSTSPDRVPDLRQKLEAFAKTLPPGVTLRFKEIE